MKKRHANTISDLPTKELPSVTLPAQQASQSMRQKNQRVDKQKFARNLLKCILLVSFVGFAIGGLFYVWSISTVTSKTSSETFTELYFEDAAHLPATIVAKHPYFFQFTLHNLEGKDMEYSYEVYIATGQSTFIFDQGMISVKKNDYKTIQENFATTSLLAKSRIVVELMKRNQQIDFLIQGSA